MANKKQKSHQDRPVLKIKLQGPGMRTGRVSIPDLIRICDEVQNAINKQAEALRGKKKVTHPGPVSDIIRKECTLELTAITGNSPTTLHFDLQKPQRGLFDNEFGIEVVRGVATTVNDVRKQRANGHAPGVLLGVYGLSGIIKPKGITRLSWIAPGIGNNGHSKSINALITKTVRQRVAKRISRPRKSIVEVDGVLEMADFKREDNKCRIDPLIGKPVLCTFTPDRADEIQALIRKHVHVRGEGVLAPYTDKIVSVRIDEVVPLTADALSNESFFANASISELMADVSAINDLSSMRSKFVDNEDVDEVLRVIYDSRK